MVTASPFPAVLRLAIANYERQVDEKMYRIYCTDTLMAIAESVAKAFGGRYMGRRYIDFVESPKSEDNRSAEEIIADIGSKLEQMGGEDE